MGNGRDVEEQRTPAQRRADAAARAQRRAQRRAGAGGDTTGPQVYEELFGDDDRRSWTDEPLTWTAPEPEAEPAADRAPAAAPVRAGAAVTDPPVVAAPPADGPPRLPRTRRPGRAPGAPAPRRRGPVPPAIAVRQRRAALVFGTVAVVAIIAWVAGLGDSTDTQSSAAPAAASADGRPQLPGGGRRLFPDRRVVAFAGNPHAEALGALGVGSQAAMVDRLKRVAEPYSRRTRPVLPAFELITSVATADPGARGDHVIRLTAPEIDRYLRLARKEGVLLLLDVQPGMVDFPRELNRLRPWLKEPDVGLALDPEWRVEPGEVPGQVIGSVSAQEVNATSLELSKIVKQYDLPQKLFVIHQFTDGMVRDPGLLVRRPGLATVFNVDGVGSQAEKTGKYTSLAANKPGFFHGFKLFYEEDKGLMTPRSVMALTPRPDLVVLE